MAPPTTNTSAYRLPGELTILAVTLLITALVIALTASVTLCASVVFIGLYVALAAFSSRNRHLALVRQARRITAGEFPRLHRLILECTLRLQPGPIAAYALPQNALNAYTFGLGKPKVVVLYTPLLQIMDRTELKFIVGHELGHVRLGHTWLNSIAGGLAGIPSPPVVAGLLTFIFLGWNRACEYSADRAGLLACGNPEKAVTALVKLVAGEAGLTRSGLLQAYRAIDAEDDTFAGSINELLSTHPMLIRRIQRLRQYANSAAYRHLQPLVAQNDALL